MKSLKNKNKFLEIAVVIALTVITAFLSFYNLGSTVAPENAVMTESGDEVYFETGDTAPDTFLFYTGILPYTRTMRVYGVDGVHRKLIVSDTVDNGDMYRWNRVSLRPAYKCAKIVFLGEGTLSEITLYDVNGRKYDSDSYEILANSATLEGFSESTPKAFTSGDYVVISTEARQAVEGSNSTEVKPYVLDKVELSCTGTNATARLVLSDTASNNNQSVSAGNVLITSGAVTTISANVVYDGYEVDFGADINVIELAFMANNARVDMNLHAPENEALSAVYDEQELFPDRTDFTNGMIFDEIYFARTAYEFITDADYVYEWTHPHLGKILISVGISLFGMNPFGWRCMSALFSVLIVPLTYLMGKVLFKRGKCAILLAFLMMIEGIRLVQGRIGTADSFLVFFILASYLNMFLFYKNARAGVSPIRWLLPLAVAGLFFGCAASVKWSGVYAGLGLFVIFVITVARRIFECRRAKRARKNGEAVSPKTASAKRTAFAVISCILTAFVFFVLTTGFIYVGAYVPHAECENIEDVDVARTVFEILNMNFPDGEYEHLGLALREANADKSEFTQLVLGVQGDIFQYHSSLDATHAYSSTFLTWPFGYKPVYFAYDDVAWDGAYARIYSGGVPVVWIGGLIGTVYSVIKLISRKGKGRDKEWSRTALFLLIGVLANYVPWMFITRCTFIYHYYPTVPFTLALAVLALARKDGAVKACEPEQVVTERRLFLFKNAQTVCAFAPCRTVAQKVEKGRSSRLVKVFLTLAVINFVLMFPLLTGLPIPRDLAWILFGWTGSV